ncbi:MAG: hypothetical protein QOI38_718 [Sphingomonadales bacterium]|jgi:hypothetical protein|nr:hypothetical protein [Sphingomonadales bacterium]
MFQLVLLLQAAAQPAPDIQLRVDVHADRVRIERRGEASLEVSGGEGSVVRVDAPEANGRRTLRNVDVRIEADARIGDPQDPPAAQNAEPAETAEPQ